MRSVRQFGNPAGALHRQPDLRVRPLQAEHRDRAGFATTTSPPIISISADSFV
jgi:hypothetical protein